MLGATEFVIGRSLYCTLVVDDASVSRLHAALRRSGEWLEVADLGSCNGTYVNGRRIGQQPYRLKVDDELRVGNLRVRMLLISEGAREQASTLPHAMLTPDDEPTGAIDLPPGTAMRGGSGG